MTIVSTYSITTKTMALLPARKVEYDTVVIEEANTIHVRQTPLGIIRQTCYDKWFTYEGRRQAVIYHTNFKKKVPIPICPVKQIYFFPTHSVHHFDNHWISYTQIANIRRFPEKTTTSIITFNNGYELIIPVSLYSLQNQMDRTFECMYRMGTISQRTNYDCTFYM